MNHSLINALDNPFWQFSLKVYSSPDVRQHCFTLQNDWQANVNLILFSCWAAYALDDLDDGEWLAACRSIDDWHEPVTVALRQIRHYLSSHKEQELTGQYYNQVLNLEITSEAFQQKKLSQYFEKHMKIKPCKDEDKAVRYLQIYFASIHNQPFKPELDYLIHVFTSLVFRAI